MQALHDTDVRASRALDAAGIVGDQLRARLVKDLKAKVVLRQARDTVEVIGAAGTGKHSVVAAAHTVARDILGRDGGMFTFDCGAVTTRPFDAALGAAIADAAGGTLVLERFGALADDRRAAATRVLQGRQADTFVMAMTDATSQPRAHAETAIRLKPLHEREDDIWELIEHFFTATVEDAGEASCLGFSRQAKADIAEVVQATNLQSVRRLRDIVRDLVFEALAEGPLPLKLTSDDVRPYLARNYGQTDAQRRERELALVASQLDSVVERSMLETLSETHDVPTELLLRQAQLLSEIVASVDGVPASYRNIMTKADDIQRAALWLMTGAQTQASFRKYFGEEGFMRPTKSVAWAFYNRVFKRDM